MNHKRYKNLIEHRLNYINNKLNTHYEATFNSNYGWCVCERNSTGGMHNGPIGFDYAKSSAELLSYLDGIYNLLCYYNVIKK